MSLITPEPSAERLICAVCAQNGHGLHFGVVSCRPCAAFFRRCVIEKRMYKCLGGTNTCNIQQKSRYECKACRMRICRAVGMIYEPRNIQGGSVSADPSLLAEFVDSYRTFVNTQRCSLNCSAIASKYSEYLRIEQQEKEMFLAILSKVVAPLKTMERQTQMDLFTNSFCRLKLLHICHLSLEQFPDSSNYLMVSIGQILDGELLEKILDEWTPQLMMRNQNKNALRCSFERMFELVKMFRSLPEKPCQRDFCALMLLTLCDSAKRLPEAMIKIKNWESYKESILENWHQDLDSRFKSNGESAMQMARLLCTLVELDSIANAEVKTRSGEKSCTGPPRQNDTDIEQQSAISLDIVQDESKELFYLVRVVKAYHRVWSAFNDTPDSYMDKFSGYENLFTNPDNILGLHESFTLNPPFFNERERSTFYREVEEYGAVPKHPRIQKATVVFRLIFAGILKAMPAFRKISTNDQILLARFLDRPISFFINGFYSAQLGANTWAGKDGVTMIDIYRAIPQYRNDSRLMGWAEKLFSDAVEIHLRHPIQCLEEFSLLLAILIAHTAVPDLSDHAKDVLYEEQLRYSRQLLRLLQMRLGPAGGACRYAEYMHMMERAFFCAHDFEMMIVYQETFHLRNEFKHFFRKGLKQFFE